MLNINITNQEFTALIQPTSQYGLNYDTVHVETLFKTDNVVPPEISWYIPSGVSIPPLVLELYQISSQDLPMYPVLAETLLKDTEDIREQAAQGNFQDTAKDAAKLLLLSVLKKATISPVPGTNNIYLVSYDFKLYKNQQGFFDLMFQIPFDGFGFPAGGQVKANIILPEGVKVDEAKTKGIATNGAEIQEVNGSAPTGRPIISFIYQNDPNFIVSYSY